MRKIPINWEKINDFLDLPQIERARISGLSPAEWARLKNSDRGIPPKKLSRVAESFGLSDPELYIAISMLKDATPSKKTEAA
jgi:hypothetical protein